MIFFLAFFVWKLLNTQKGFERTINTHSSCELNIGAAPSPDTLISLFADEIGFFSKMGVCGSVFIAFMSYDKDDIISSSPIPHLLFIFLSFKALIDFIWNPSWRLKLYQGTRRSRTFFADLKKCLGSFPFIQTCLQVSLSNVETLCNFEDPR